MTPHSQSTTTHPAVHPEGFLKPGQVLDILELKDGMQIADFGCGSGFFSIPIAEHLKRGGKVYAIDIQKGALESVRSQARAKNLSNVTPIWADLEVPHTTKIKEGTLDLVIVSNIIFQVGRKKVIFQEANFLLKPQGKLIVVEWAENALFGPPKNHRLSKSQILNLAREQNFLLERELDLSATHYAVIFLKSK